MPRLQRRLGAFGLACFCAALAAGASAQNSFVIQQSGPGPGSASVWSAPGAQSVVATTGPRILAPAPFASRGALFAAPLGPTGVWSGAPTVLVAPAEPWSPFATPFDADLNRTILRQQQQIRRQALDRIELRFNLGTHSGRIDVIR